MMMGMIMSGVQLMEMLPFSVMVVMEGCTIILTIWAKTAMTDYDMSPFVFVVYTHVLSSIILLLSTFVFNCRSRSATHPSLFSFGLFVRCFLLGLTGIAVSQNLAFLGLSYSSPILVCAMGLMLPTFSFLLSVILKRTNADWRSPTFQAKVLGTVISIMGAVIVELYKGPYIRPSSVLSSSSYMVLFQKAGQYLKFSSSATEHWVLGGLLLVGASISVSVWNIIQLAWDYPVCNILFIHRKKLKCLENKAQHGSPSHCFNSMFCGSSPKPCTQLVHEIEGNTLCAKVQTIWHCFCHHFRCQLICK
ncbi:WAT1-related protein At1g70260 isoform X2 [Argentina anserina]|uniref:WAT1-related protein At1g70260 isoform X2 n=1 Tax=Argentina anserina TaxID=57926 RepID=UPI0021763EC4|nr:WAT1-related protein At1g70260 isoform X2 [Potentilla anserina]